ncbi:uncharacterized protein AMSG_01227 [Thecamonas trahens ATCC 50062]|uniref:MYND-type domain-containing protein n=1 Tax=Thecamonas trahens ATCC 50062 TaxID=461836 RepID=A0A0L0DMG4_THETB|nr:hypothetical protein AMSG_01227 [Thecamonas trahens ATCC 50062]KNC53514.1 hypothetical protein AMSG_01227 [Thecamonas trahens ATCC 50062]|eukprot:XP_013761835.1 hypothetical protein AMSG_01227 [Thecamonas trahens ATCC 50062]
MLVDPAIATAKGNKEKAKLKSLVVAKKALRQFVRADAPYATAVGDAAAALADLEAFDLVAELGAVAPRKPYCFDGWRAIEALRADADTMPLFDAVYPLLLVMKDDALPLEQRVAAANTLTARAAPTASTATATIEDLITCEAYILIRALRDRGAREPAVRDLADACQTLLGVLGENGNWTGYALAVEQGRDNELRAKRTCAKCRTLMAEGTALKRCSRCKKTVYCSRDCQVAHWKIHKPACKAVAKA